MRNRPPLATTNLAAKHYDKKGPLRTYGEQDESIRKIVSYHFNFQDQSAWITKFVPSLLAPPLPLQHHWRCTKEHHYHTISALLL